MDKHGDTTTIDQNSESIYIDYCKLNIEECKKIYNYLVEQLNRRKTNIKKENEEMTEVKRTDIISFENNLRENGGRCYLNIEGQCVPVQIERIDYKYDESPTFEGYFYEYSYEPKRKTKSKVRYSDYYNRSRQYISTLPKIKDVIFNPPATIILWEDNTKTVVKCQDGYEFDPWTGLTTAIVKKVLGNKSNYCNVLNEWIDKYEAKEAIKLGDIIEKIKDVRPLDLATALSMLYGENTNDEG